MMDPIETSQTCNLPFQQGECDRKMEALLEGLQKQESRGRLLTSCETELQELMRQIDIMVLHKKSEWESQTRAISALLKLREQELASAREMLEQSHREVGKLQQQLDSLGRVKQSLSEEYEHQLGKVQEELIRLKRSYEKLQRKQLKEAREEAKSKREDHTEVNRLSRKTEDFCQKSLDWEKQRILYQQQVASLEAQRKTFTDQSELHKEQSQSYRFQFSSQKQMHEQTELLHQSEIQHLTSQLERAEETIRVKELESERLSLRLEDSFATKQKLVEEQLRAQEELTHARTLLEVLKEEKEELRLTLQLQEDFLQSSRVQQDQIQKELARVNENLQAKELGIRSLEASLREKWISKEDQEEMERALCQLEISQKSEQSLWIVVSHLEGRIQSTNNQCVQLKRELAETKEQLHLLMEQHSMCKAEANKLREQLTQAERTYSGNLEGMKHVVSQLTQELHQRDVFSDSTSGIEAEREAVESRCPHTCSLIGSIATRFLEQEEMRSQQLLECLDIHIDELKRESQKTLEHFSQTK
ncbi:centrosomal protein of 63 kDa isoform X2 [Microcaecilia unicolor]|nr:centrosomal protein of 63 kDa isoform X2 [Microcaecilia unicolor]XP_030073006.1 centrosomal protein of 63 kDa isoform X2 [Microcaecilia unicolor]XP_030073007.1 centrosomal protein of 63 kDa isoform X2 [Microcaecilia unicolor]